MLRIAVCDDEPAHLQLAESLVRKTLENNDQVCTIQLFSSAAEFLSEVTENHYSPDIAVLDIEMYGENGISLAKKLNQALPGCRIIFLTGYLNYAQDAYEAEHIWFVLKKDSGRYFEPAVRKALRSLEEDTPVQGILVKEKGTSVFVPLDKILYISKVDRKAQVRCLDKEYYDTRRPALLIPDRLNGSFIRCHQGYWVNVNMIRELDHDTFILRDGTIIPISRTFRDEARKSFFERFRI